MPSSPQTLTTLTLFDYELNVDGTARVNAPVTVTPSAPVVNGSPVVNLSTQRSYLLTDANGYWSATLVRSQGITEYVVTAAGAPSYRVTIPVAGAGPFQASANKAADSY